MELELMFAKMQLEEKNNLANIFNNKEYNGWYKYVLDNDEYIDIIVRFRMPPTVPLYSDILKNFKQEERIFGIHRMLIGKDLQDELKEILKNTLEDVDKILDLSKLTDEQAKDLLQRMKNMITFDCNKIPYLHIRQNKNEINEEKNNLIIKNFLDNQKDYIKLFQNVLNEKITILEATDLSNNVIFNEDISLRK